MEDVFNLECIHEDCNDCPYWVDGECMIPDEPCEMEG